MHPVRAAFKALPPPRAVVAHLVYFKPTDDNMEYWTVRLYRDNFETFSAEDKLVIFNWVSDVIQNIRTVEPNCWPEVYERVPR